MEVEGFVKTFVKISMTCMQVQLMVGVHYKGIMRDILHNLTITNNCK